MHGTEKGEDGPSEYHVVKVANYELGIVDMDIGGCCTEDQSC